MPVTLNQRYVFAARREGFGLILRDLDAAVPYASRLRESFAYRPFRGEEEPPDWRRLDDLLGRQRRSGFRRCHNGFFGELLTDAQARRV